MKSSYYKKILIFFKTASLVFLHLLAVNANAQNVAFFYALDTDWKKFLSENENSVQVVEVNTAYAQRTNVNGVTLYGLKMGSGSVRTAISAQQLLGATNFDLIISTGPIGSISSKHQQNQIVIATDIIPWQTVADIRSATSTDFKPIRPLAPSGDWSELLSDFEDIQVASGEVFICNSEHRAALRNGTSAEAVDMNLYGLLSVLEDYQVPSIHLRVVSDYADENAVDDFSAFRKQYNGKLGLLVSNIIKNLPKDTTDPDSYPELRKLFGP